MCLHAISEASSRPQGDTERPLTGAEAARTENQAASLAERQPNVRRQSRHAQLEESVSKVNLASIAKAPDGKPAASQMRAVHKAHTVACDSENDEDVPPL